MQEIVFIVEDDAESGFIAKALEVPIFTEAETFEAWKEVIKEAVHCHFDDSQKRIIRLHYVKEEVFAA